MAEQDVCDTAKAWSTATDADVVRAVRSADSYDPRVRRVIEAECERRQLALTALAEGDGLGATVLGRVWHVMWRLLTAHRVVPAILLGAFVGVLRAWVWQGVPSRRLLIALPALILLVFPCALILLNWPFDSYRRGTLLALGGWFGYSPSAFVVVYEFDRQYPGLMTGAVLGAVLGLVGTTTATVALTNLVVAVRRRYRPIYAANRCERCGYLLYGLPERRCPECGTPF